MAHLVVVSSLAGLLAVATPASATGTFTDDDGNIHESAIEAIVAAGITAGCNPPVNTRYCPDAPVNRGQMAAFLTRLLDLPASTGNSFNDDDGSVFEADIESIAQAGITNGCNPPANDSFCPNRPVTRGEMAALLARALGLPTTGGDYFADDDASIFEASINAIAQAGITSGCNPPADTEFCPHDRVLRDQMATFMSRTGRVGGSVEIVGESFHIGGTVTNPGSDSEGLLLNSRMVQAVIDIEGKVGPFLYPDTGTWDPGRNTNDIVAALPAYAAAGLDAVTVNLQGGNPLAAPIDDKPEWTISAYGPDGSLDPAWMGRLDRVLAAADGEGMAVIVGLFYFGQDHRLDDEAAVTAAVDNVVDWLMAGGYRNVLIEICNECDVQYDHDILRPDRVTELIQRVEVRSKGRLAASASLSGGHVPSNAWIDASEYILLHGNRQDPGSITHMVQAVRDSPAFEADPRPIVFNEDSTDLANLDAAVEAGAGWGYHDKGDNDYINGYQAPPINWSINTDPKRAFFHAVTALTN